MWHGIPGITLRVHPENNINRVSISIHSFLPEYMISWSLVSAKLGPSKYPNSFCTPSGKYMSQFSKYQGWKYIKLITYKLGCIRALHVKSWTRFVVAVSRSWGVSIQFAWVDSFKLTAICVHHGDFYVKVTGMLVGKLDINPLRETNVRVAQA